MVCSVSRVQGREYSLVLLLLLLLLVFWTKRKGRERSEGGKRNFTALSGARALSTNSDAAVTRSAAERGVSAYPRRWLALAGGQRRMAEGGNTPTQCSRHPSPAATKLARFR